MITKTGLITGARNFALEKHSKQMYDKYPYSFHLEAVEAILLEAGYENNELIMASGWLHDVLEDTDTSYMDLIKLFSNDVANVVNACSKLLGNNRLEKMYNTVPLLKAIPEALIIKLADRIANTEYNLVHNSSYHKMYVKEYPLFVEWLYNEEDTHLLGMWNRLKHCSVS